MPALLFGSISTVADTSELQRDAFNKAFAEHGLDWRWDRADYLAKLESSGGRQRIVDQAAKRGEDVDATAVHQTKTKIFQQDLARAQLSPRPGVVETIRAAKDAGFRVGLITTTARENVTALIEALAPAVTAEDFDLVTDVDTVGEPKPDGAVYLFALEAFGEQPSSCVAIEDNLGGVQAAMAAGVPCVAYPNENTAEHDFSAATTRVNALDPQTVLAHATR